MIIKFIKQCKAPQQRWRTHCPCCGPVMDGWENTTFFVGEEYEITLDQNYSSQFENIDIKGLTFNEHYTIIQFP